MLVKNGFQGFCHQHKYSVSNNRLLPFYLGHMKEMIENFNRYQIINESTGNVIKVSHMC